MGRIAGAVAAGMALSAVVGITQHGAGGVPGARDYALTPVPLQAVRLTDDFWRPRHAVNRDVSLPHILRENERTGRLDNFARAARLKPGAFKGRRYNDTDVYKAVEAASYVLAVTPDTALDRQVDAIVALIAAAQEPDGYLFTTRTIDPANPAPGAGATRWEQLNSSHELYNAGHLYEAAVAHHEATGKRTLLDVAIRNADLVVRTFGSGARRDVPGHQEIELALVKLARATGNTRYLETARFFLEERGRPRTHPRYPPGSPFEMYNAPRYRQDHLPAAAQLEAVGHAVRATYMYSGMTDVGVLAGDPALLEAVDRLWQDVVSKRMYLTGGLGSHGDWEAFGEAYALPNAKAYAETCASIGGLLWYHRMFLRGGDGQYLDTLERTLYNGALAGVSAAGDTFFYENPLASPGGVGRQRFFDVACCPANLARLLAQLPTLMYATRSDTLFVNLFASSRARVTVAGTAVEVAQETRYPWDGAVRLRLEPEHPVSFTLRVRVPGWARGQAVPGDLYRYAGPGAVGAVGLRVNGEAVQVELDNGFAPVSRTWRAGDVVELALEMPVRRVVAHPAVEDNAGRAAIERGPLVYCVESADLGGGSPDALRVPLDAVLRSEFRQDLLGGLAVITGTATVDGGAPRTFTAVPYFAWANRGDGAMAVWLRQE